MACFCCRSNGGSDLGSGWHGQGQMEMVFRVVFVSTFCPRLHGSTVPNALMIDKVLVGMAFVVYVLKKGVLVLIVK